jgi:hypothetical protein
MAAEPGVIAGEMERAGREVADALMADRERLRRENQHLQSVLAILLRKLGGDVLVTEGDQVDEDATLIRVPERDGYRLLLRERVPFSPVVIGRLPEETSPGMSGTGRAATDKEV